MIGAREYHPRGMVSEPHKKALRLLDSTSLANGHLGSLPMYFTYVHPGRLNAGPDWHR